jgi:hypothetical protein
VSDLITRHRHIWRPVLSEGVTVTGSEWEPEVLVDEKPIHEAERSPTFRYVCEDCGEEKPPRA